MRVFLVLGLLVLASLIGCTNQSEVALRDTSVFTLNKRNVIERDLTVPYTPFAPSSPVSESMP